MSLNILITNDDGVYAPGIRALYRAVKDLGKVTVVAPLEEKSTTGHSLTLNDPLRVHEIEENIYGVTGYPADSAVIGFGHILKDNRPDLVLSGINRGGNLGQDFYYSGTIGAAREACFHGLKSIAISSVIDMSTPDHTEEHFETAGNFVKDFILKGGAQTIPDFGLININCPNLPESEIKGTNVTHIGFRKYSDEVHERTDARGRKYYWIGGRYQGHDDYEKSDCQTITNGKISLTMMDVLYRGVTDTDLTRFVEEHF